MERPPRDPLSRPLPVHDDFDDDRLPADAALRLPTGPARGKRERLRRVIRDIPNFVKLLYRLTRDPRVSAVDKAILVASIAYILMPLDLVPDFIPFLGQVDDIYLLALVLDRLLTNAGLDVVLDHWDGDPETLELALEALETASSFLPARVRELLHRRIG